MKTTALLLLCFVLTGNFCSGQNLVPNPSFEEYTACPDATDQLDRALSWTSYRGSPDYFNTCASMPVSIPLNAWGSQEPYHGTAYAFLGTYDNMGVNYREHLGCQLLQELDSGVKYYVTAFISRADFYLANGASNNFGFRFSNSSFSKNDPAPIDNFSDVHSVSINTDSANWARIDGSFIADSTYKYLIIGNFYDDLHTDTLDINNNASGYYVDAVCVSKDSLAYLYLTGVSKNYFHAQLISVFPNPASDKVTITGSATAVEYSLYDFYGRILKQGVFQSKNERIDVTDYENGQYILRIEKSFYKILVHH